MCAQSVRLITTDCESARNIQRKTEIEWPQNNRARVNSVLLYRILCYKMVFQKQQYAQVRNVVNTDNADPCCLGWFLSSLVNGINNTK